MGQGRGGGGGGDGNVMLQKEFHVILICNSSPAIPPLFEGY